MLLCNVVECAMYGSGWVGTSKLAAWKSKEGPSCRQRLGKHLRGEMSPSYHFFFSLFSLAPLPTFDSIKNCFLGSQTEVILPIDSIFAYLCL